MDDFITKNGIGLNDWRTYISNFGLKNLEKEDFSSSNKYVLLEKVCLFVSMLLFFSFTKCLKQWETDKNIKMQIN